MGRSMASRSPEKSMISSARLEISALVKPRASPPMRMLRRPERAGRSAEDTPSSDGLQRPWIVPDSSGSSPVMAESSVVLPAPLAPIRPRVSDSCRSRLTPRRARIVRYRRRARPSAKICFSPGTGSS